MRKSHAKQAEEIIQEATEHCGSFDMSYADEAATAQVHATLALREAVEALGRKIK